MSCPHAWNTTVIWTPSVSAEMLTGIELFDLCIHCDAKRPVLKWKRPEEDK